MNAELLISLFVVCMLLGVLGMAIVMGKKLTRGEKRMDIIDKMIDKVKKKKIQLMYLALLWGWRIKF